MSLMNTATGLARNDANFDCNICLEFVQDPVVSLCGHLYCWPCIYKWIHVNGVSSEDSDPRPQCPVCKAQVSIAALVPLYGRGRGTDIAYEREAPNCGLIIPHRPSAPICQEMSPMSFGHHQQLREPYPTHGSASYTASSVHRLGGTNSFQPIIEILGEMVSSRVFGPSIRHDHSNSYNSAMAHTPRVRRQLIRADQSLSRLCFFFFCCMIMCLLLF